jgi:hypothetical protein
LCDYTFEVAHRTDSYEAQRGLEQMLHDLHKPPLDYIKPISPTNPRRNIYLEAARIFL